MSTFYGAIVDYVSIHIYDYLVLCNTFDLFVLYLFLRYRDLLGLTKLLRMTLIRTFRIYVLNSTMTLK